MYRRHTITASKLPILYFTQKVKVQHNYRFLTLSEKTWTCFGSKLSCLGWKFRRDKHHRLRRASPHQNQVSLFIHRGMCKGGWSGATMLFIAWNDFTKNAYYFQIQCLMGILQLDKCMLVVWCPMVMLVIPVNADPLF